MGVSVAVSVNVVVLMDVEVAEGVGVEVPVDVRVEVTMGVAVMVPVGVAVAIKVAVRVPVEVVVKVDRGDRVVVGERVIVVDGKTCTTVTGPVEPGVVGKRVLPQAIGQKTVANTRTAPSAFFITFSLEIFILNLGKPEKFFLQAKLRCLFHTPPAGTQYIVNEKNVAYLTIWN